MGNTFTTVTRPGGTKRKLKARFVAKEFTSTTRHDNTCQTTSGCPACEQDNNILWKLNKQLYGLRDSPQKFHLRLSSTLKQLGLRQLGSDQCVYHSDDVTGALTTDWR
eukprot:219760-Amphidinium_carterae.1